MSATLATRLAATLERKDRPPETEQEAERAQAAMEKWRRVLEENKP